MNTIQVHTTTDYGKFRLLNGNRKLKSLHMQRLKKSMQEEYLFTIITVNEFLEIIDGQHRFHVAKELALPINYVIKPGYGINQVQKYNITNEKWKIEDYLDSYCREGIREYIIFQEFIQRHNINIPIGMILLCSTDSGPKIEDFKNRRLRIKNLHEADEKAKKLKELEKYCSLVFDRSFVAALGFLVKHPDFNFNELVLKFKIHGDLDGKVKRDKEAYIADLEKVYNYGRKNGKVNLRFLPKEILN